MSIGSIGSSRKRPPKEHRLNSHWRLLGLRRNEAASKPFKCPRRVGGFGVPFTPRDPEVVQCGFIVVLVLITWLHFVYVSCGQPVVDCCDAFSHLRWGQRPSAWAGDFGLLRMHGSTCDGGPTQGRKHESSK